jgi:hypothetical protein
MIYEHKCGGFMSIDNEDLSFPPEAPLFCRKQGNCKRVWQTNTPACTMALYCEKKYHSTEKPTQFCIYLFSCGAIVCAHVEVSPSDTLKVTLSKASAVIMPKLMKVVSDESKAPGCVWH